MNKVVVGIVAAALLAGVVLIISSRQESNRQGIPVTPSVTVSQTPSEASSPAQENQEQTTITLTSSGFDPQTITVKAGTKVTWINQGGSDATVNSAPHPAHTDYPPLNLGSFSDGGELTLTFDKPGTYRYHNHLNPTQFGSVVVQ